MKKLTCIMIGIFIILQSGTTINAQYSIPDLVERIKPSIVTIITYNEHNQPIGQGSGFFIDYQHIVSNSHVFEGVSHAEAILYDQSSVLIKGFVYQNARTDQISVRITGKGANVTPLKFARAIPKQGETVVVIGSPYGLEQSVTEGIISSIRYDNDYGELIQITAPISPGSSGSPVLNLKGELVGIATFQLVAGQNLNFAIPFKSHNNLHRVDLQPFSKIKTQLSNDIIPTDLQFLLAANLSFLDSKYDEALHYYQKSIKANHLNIDAYIGAGKCKWHLKDAKSAEAYFDRALKIEPENAVPYYKVAAFYHSLGTHSKRVQLLVRKANQLRLKSINDYLTASDELLKLGYRRKAYNLIDFALLRSHRKIQIYLYLSSLYGTHNLLMKKIEVLEEILKIFPSTNEQYRALAGKYALMGLKNKMRVYKEIAETYNQLGMRDKVKQTYERAAIDEPETPDGYYVLANMFHKLGRYRDEINCYKNVIALDSGHFNAHYDLAMLYKELGFPNEAVLFLKKAISIDPDNSSAFFELGSIYLEYEHFQEAIHSFKQLIRILPDAGTGYYLLGLAYSYAGKKNLALRQLEILNKIDPQSANDLYKAIFE